jgi:hydrogenase maturation protease
MANPWAIAVLGLGNLLRTDDGVGIHAIRRLQSDRRLSREIQLIDGGTLGLSLLPSLQQITHLLVLDAVDVGAVAGAPLRFANRDIDRLPLAKSVHLLGLADLLNSLRLLGQAPADVTLIGVQPGSTDWGVTLSPAVEAKLDQLVEAACSQIAAWLNMPETRTNTSATAGLKPARAATRPG